MGYFAAVALLVAAPAVARNEAPKDLANRAVDLMAAHNAAAALAAADQAIAGFRKQYGGEKREIYCGLRPIESLMYMTMAASAKKSAIAIEPDWCTALFIRGFALIDLKRVDEGTAALETVVKMAPYHAHFINELAYAYQQQRAWQLSHDTYERAVGATEFSPKEDQTAERTRAWRGMGFALVELNKLDEAAAMYRKCLALDPNDEKSKGELRYIAEEKAKRS